MDRRMTALRALEEEGARLLEAAGIEEARLDAHRLLLAAFQLDETHYLLNRSGPAEEPGDGRYREMIGLRAARIPLQQILGQQEFMGLTFQVDRHVLIPRQDTETLVELVLAEQTDPRKRVLDLCTGSGCIAVSLAVKGGYTDVTASDLSAEALKVAERNAEALLAGERRIFSGGEGSGDGSGEVGAAPGSFRLYRGDLFDALPEGERYDIIVSNPPYIPSAVIGGLQPEVRDHEPRMALDGSEDGLIFYRRIAAGAPDRLNPGGAVYLEIGCDQAEAVSALLETEGFTDIQVFKDLPGLDRVVRARRNRELPGWERSCAAVRQ